MNQLSVIAKYSSDISYLKGKSHFVANALLRPNGVTTTDTMVLVSSINNINDQDDEWNDLGHSRFFYVCLIK